MNRAHTFVDVLLLCEVGGVWHVPNLAATEVPEYLTGILGTVQMVRRDPVQVPQRVRDDSRRRRLHDDVTLHRSDRHLCALREEEQVTSGGVGHMRGEEWRSVLGREDTQGIRVLLLRPLIG